MTTEELTIHAHLATLSEPVRDRLLVVLEREELGVGELTRILQLPQSTVSRHLKKLTTHGWVSRRTEGTASYVRLSLELNAVQQGLWQIIRGELEGTPQHAEDLQRLDQVLAARRVDSRAFFERVADGWDRLREELFGQRLDEVALYGLLPPDLVVADLGCGTGQLIERIAGVVERVHGVDREQTMLDAAARRLARFNNITLHQGSLDALPLPDRAVSVVTCVLVLHHVEAPAQALREMARVLRPGGRVVLVDMVAHDRELYRRTMGHHHLGFSAEALSEVLTGTGLRVAHRRHLPPDPEAQGPPLFVAVLERR